MRIIIRSIAITLIALIAIVTGMREMSIDDSHRASALPSEEAEWQEYNAIAFKEYAAEFDALFNDLTYVRTTTRETMRRGNGKFVYSKAIK